MQVMSNIEEYVLIGGGRWARQYLQTLLRVTPIESKVIVITKHNKDKIQNNFSTAIEEKRLVVHHDMDSLRIDNVVLSIVANAAEQHYETTIEMLSHKIPTLVEKPIALSFEACSALLGAATRNSTSLFGSNLILFSPIAELLGVLRVSQLDPIEVVIKWSDSADEIRYGEVKRFNHKINALLDIMPHILNLLNCVFTQTSELMIDHDLTSQPRSAAITFRRSDAVCKVHIDQGSHYRERLITLVYSDGSINVIDFTNENKILYTGSNRFAKKTSLNQIQQRPMARMLESAMHSISQQITDLRLSPYISLEYGRIFDLVGNS